MTAGGNSFKNATAHKVNSYYMLAISYCIFCVGKHTILGPGSSSDGDDGDGGGGSSSIISSLVTYDNCTTCVQRTIQWNVHHVQKYNGSQRK